MTAVAELGAQSVRAVGKLGDAVEAVYLHKMHRYAEAGRCGAPAPRAEQNRVLIAQETVELAEPACYLILALLGQSEIRLDSDHDGVANRQAHITAHEVALRAEIKLLYLGHDADGAYAARLKRPALQEVHAVVALFVKIAGVLYIDRIVVLFLEYTHRLGHDGRKIRFPEQLAEVEYIRRVCGAQPHFAQPCCRGIVKLHKQRRIGLYIALFDAVNVYRLKLVALEVYHVHFVLRVFILVAVGHHRRRGGRVHVQKPCIVVGLAVDRTRTHAENEAQHALVFRRGVLLVQIQVLRVADTGDVRIVIVAVNVAAHAHDQKRHLLIAVEKVSFGAVFYSVRVDGAGVDLLYRALEYLIALLEAALIGAENALVLSGEGVAEAVLKDRA